MSYTYQPNGPISTFTIRPQAVQSPHVSSINLQVRHPTDYFPDTGVSVGDSMIFGNKDGWSSGTFINTAYGKYHGIQFDVTTPIVAAVFTGVWEYASTPSVAGTVVWTALSNVKTTRTAFKTQERIR